MRKPKPITQKMKQLVVMITPEQFAWLHQASKAQKTKLAPFVRSVISYIQESAPKEIYNRMAEARLKSELEAASKAVEEATRLKEAKEQELAELAS